MLNLNMGILIPLQKHVSNIYIYFGVVNFVIIEFYFGYWILFTPEDQLQSP